LPLKKTVWVSREIVAEPHSFDIEIIAQTATEPFMFVMSKEEGKIELTDAQIKAASISLDTAVKANIKTALLLPREIRLNEDRTSHVVPRLRESWKASMPTWAKWSRKDKFWR
jgi:cobalt-zinc-cadmium efflux system membrane fusion protein